MMREGGPAYEDATDGFDGIDMEAANRRATRRVSTANAVLGGCVPSSRNDATKHRRRAVSSTLPRAPRPSCSRVHAARRAEEQRRERAWRLVAPESAARELDGSMD